MLCCIFCIVGIRSWCGQSVSLRGIRLCPEHNNVSVYVFPTLFDMLEYANVATLQNALPVFYTMYEGWQLQASDSKKVALMKFGTLVDV